MPFAKVGDLNIHYEVRGEGVPIVFVHGNWTTLAEWERVLELLPAGYRAITYDLRGRGQTQGPDNNYTMPEMAADLLGLVDYLGLNTFHLVAHSLGSAVAMQFTLEHPGRVLSLVVLAPGWVDGMPEAYNVPAGQQAAKANKEVLAVALKAQMPTAPEDAYWQRLVDEAYGQGLEASLRNLPALLEWKPGDRLAETGVPAIVISGEQDVLTGGANAERAAQALLARNVVVPGVGHSPNIEAPGEFVRLMMEHITRVGSPAN